MVNRRREISQSRPDASWPNPFAFPIPVRPVGSPAQALGAFEHAFLINRDDDTERLARSTSELARAGIRAERLPAAVPTERGNYQSTGARGCAQSHERAVRLARKRSYRSVLIFEDDVILRRDFLGLWRRIEHEVAQLDYDLFFFYRWRVLAWSSRKLETVRIESTLCSHAYAVHSRFYDEALRHYGKSAEPGTPADQLFTSASARIYAPTFNLAGQAAGDSLIVPARKARRWSAYTDRLPWLSPFLWF